MTPHPLLTAAFLVLLGAGLAAPAAAQPVPLRSGVERTAAPPRLMPARLAGARLDEVEPNNTPEEAQRLDGPLPISVEGTVATADAGSIGLDLDGDGVVDEDFEDFYVVTTTTPGLSLRLEGAVADVDVYLIDEAVRRSIDAGATIGVSDELLRAPGLPPGTYFIAVTIFDPEPVAAETAYTLTVEAASAVPVEEAEPNNTLADAQPLDVGPLDFLFGTIDVDDAGALRTDTGDDLEDLFLLTTPEPGLRVKLTLHGADCDLYLADPTTGVILGQSSNSRLSQEFIDVPDLPAGTYLLAVTIRDDDFFLDPATFYLLTLENVISTATETAEVPEALRLDPNYPNPFNPTTQIHFALPAPADVRLDVFDAQGRRLRTLVDVFLPAGSHRATWDGRDDAGRPVASGVYLYRLTTGSHTASRTMVLLR